MRVVVEFKATLPACKSMGQVSVSCGYRRTNTTPVRLKRCGGAFLGDPPVLDLICEFSPTYLDVKVFVKHNVYESYQ